jgi:hypothetical protein
MASARCHSYLFSAATLKAGLISSVKRRKLKDMAQLPKHHEHRWGDRIEFDMPVKIATSASTGIDARLKNVSLSGALIEAGHDLRLHTLVEVCIQLPPPSQRSAVIDAYVSRKRDQQIGIEWCQFAPIIIKELFRVTATRPLP